MAELVFTDGQYVQHLTAVLACQILNAAYLD